MARYFCLEGADGVGKTSLAMDIVQRLRGFGYPVLYTKEPRTRDLGIGKDQFENAIIYTLDRYRHARLIREQLDMGNTIIGDRCYVSTVVYNLWEFPAEYRDEYVKLSKIKKMCPPDHVFIIDKDVDVVVNSLLRRDVDEIPDRDLIETYLDRYIWFSDVTNSTNVSLVGDKKGMMKTSDMFDFILDKVKGDYDGKK